jgi:hypothetical protein
LSLSDAEILKLVAKEFKAPTLGATEQYLEIHQPILENGILKIDRIDRESDRNIIISYIPVENEYFHFAVYIDGNTAEILNVGTESRNTVSLCITSEDLDITDLALLKNLNNTRSWNKGDLRGKNATYNYSFVQYEPNPEPDEFEDKLKKLLVALLKEKGEINKLVSTANTYVRVVMDFHSGNQLLGSADIDLECLKLLTELNLRIHFEFAAWGEPFK